MIISQTNNLLKYIKNISITDEIKVVITNALISFEFIAPYKNGKKTSVTDLYGIKRDICLNNCKEYIDAIKFYEVEKVVFFSSYNCDKCTIRTCVHHDNLFIKLNKNSDVTFNIKMGYNNIFSDILNEYILIVNSKK